MRILAMSDVHGNFDVYQWMQLLVAADPVDAVVLAGDLLHGAGDHLSVEEAQRREADQLIGLWTLYPTSTNRIYQCLVNDGDVTGVPARKLSLDLDDFSPPFRVE